MGKAARLFWPVQPLLFIAISIVAGWRELSANGYVVLYQIVERFYDLTEIVCIACV